MIDFLVGSYTMGAISCQEHKIRNVKSYLPKKYHQPMERKLRAAYGMTGYDDARDALLSIVRELERLNEDAAASLREGLEETPTCWSQRSAGRVM